jgi:hypothetical protein
MATALPKCPHGVYTGGLPTGRSLYCSSCTPEGPPEDDSESGPVAFQTCSACWRTKRIEEFPVDPRTGEPYENCLDCTPHPRVLNPKPPEAGRCRVCGTEIEPPAGLCTSCEQLQSLADCKVPAGNRQARLDLRHIRTHQWPKQNPERRKEHGLRRRDRYGTGDFTLEAWLEKLQRAGWLCTFCERGLTFETAVCVRWIPASLGGRNDIDNCTPACARCQSIRAASFRWHSGRAA